MLTDQEIQQAIDKISPYPSTHQHPDCVRIAYAWLDAQKKIQTINNKPHALKHTIENWAGRYVSLSDVEVAAYLHPEIKGTYPNYNISSKLTEPCRDRLTNISEAMKHPSYHEKHDPKYYKYHE